VRGPGHRPGRAHEQSVFRSLGRDSEGPLDSGKMWKVWRENPVDSPVENEVSSVEV